MHVHVIGAIAFLVELWIPLSKSPGGGSWVKYIIINIIFIRDHL